jgi:DNA-binding transcriptional regulator LsrR (DeoR family)
MAGKPKRMGQVKQLIRLYEQGLGKKNIARRLGMSKNTVKTYIQKIEKGELSTGILLVNFNVELLDGEFKIASSTVTKKWSRWPVSR